VLGAALSCGSGHGRTPVAPGTYAIQVVGTAALTSHQAGVTLTVVAP
jgi:hypothetical protein